MEGYQLGPRAKTDFDGMRRRYHRHPDAGQARHRRVNWGDTTTDGNGNSSGPCGCCNCLDCIDLCDARAEDVIADCEACNGPALTRYAVDVGNWAAWPDLGGTIVLTHTAETCQWVSDNLTDTTTSGVYRWILTQAGAASTLQLQHVSGADPVHLLNGWRRVKFEAIGSWNCLCASQMKAVSIERIPKPAGLNCAVCVIPRLSVFDPTCPTIPAIDGVIPCFPEFRFPGIDFLFSEANPNHCKYLTCVNIPGNPEFEFPYGFTGTTVRTIFLSRGLDEHCPWSGALDEVEPVPPVTSNGISIGGHDGVTFSVAVSYTAGTIDLTFYSYQGEVNAQYYLDPDDWVIGLNTLDLINDYGSDSAVTWPATVEILATDCMYASSHPDYGYGCGYGATDSGGGECGGPCRYVADIGYQNTGDPNNPDGPWTWIEYNDNALGFPGCGTACSCSSPPSIPPTSYSDTYSGTCA